MSSDEPSRPSGLRDDSAIDRSGATSGIDTARQAPDLWTSLVDAWWRKQSDSLPDDLRRTLRITLDQSMAMWALACGLPAAGSGRPVSAAESGIPAHPAMGPWQPVLEALRACEASALSGQPARSGEYALAYGAYAGEFARLNQEVSRQIQDRLHRLGADVGFVELHRQILEAAEDAYLAHVSSDEFASCQAKFVNALLRCARMSQDGQTPVSGAT